MLQIIDYSEKAIAVCGDTREVKESLKALGGRFNGRLTCGAGWIFSAKKRPELEALLAGGEITKSTIKKESQKAEKTNKFGVKVGDIFRMTWGYDQTNNDFFQVIELVGANSVRVRECYPTMLESRAISGMSEDRVFSIPKNGELCKYPESSIFIKDQQKGDLKHLKTWAADGVSDPHIKIDNDIAHFCAGDTIKVYESWYA